MKVRFISSLRAVVAVLCSGRLSDLLTLRRPALGGRKAAKTDFAHGTRLFYELWSCGEPFRRMGRGGWPAMRSRHQEMASLCAASRIFLSRSKPTRKID